MLARKTGLEAREVAKVLGYLRNVGFYYVPPRKEPRITFKMIRVPLDRLVITTASYENRLAAFKMRIEKVVEYLEMCIRDRFGDAALGDFATTG